MLEQIQKHFLFFLILKYSDAITLLKMPTHRFFQKIQLFSVALHNFQLPNYNTLKIIIEYLSLVKLEDLGIHDTHKFVLHANIYLLFAKMFLFSRLQQINLNLRESK